VDTTSEWATAGVSAWTSKVYLLYKDLPEDIASFIFLYADNAKVFRRVECEVDKEALQRDLDQLADWAKKWQLRFNIDKCRWEASDTARNNRRERSRSVGELHCETNNPRGPCSHEGEPIVGTDQENIPLRGL